MHALMQNSNQFPWEYFNRGNANLILVSKKDASQLLRLRLDKSNTLTSECVEYTNKILEPIFKEYLVRSEVVELTAQFKQSVLEIFNIAIDQNENWGLLMENINPGVEVERHKYDSLYWDKSTGDYVLELKPKWLYRDLDSIYCRNCANNAVNRKTVSKEYCVLGLLSNKSQTVDEIFSRYKVLVTQQLKKQFLEYLNQENNVFDKLCLYQNVNDNRHRIKTLGGPSDVDEDLLLGMTLRDVTLFFTFKKSKVVVKMIDLDRKPKSKWNHWKAVETQLIQKGYNGNFTWKSCRITRPNS